MERIKRVQMCSLGRILTKHGLENAVLTGKTDGERDRGSLRQNFMRILDLFKNFSTIEIIH